MHSIISLACSMMLLATAIINPDRWMLPQQPEMEVMNCHQNYQAAVTLYWSVVAAIEADVEISSVPECTESVERIFQIDFLFMRYPSKAGGVALVGSYSPYEGSRFLVFYVLKRHQYRTARAFGPGVSYCIFSLSGTGSPTSSI